MTGRKAEKITIEGCADAPTVNGCNFFSGEYLDEDEGGGSISGGVSQRDWEFFWRRHARAKPPGPLPEGAQAIMWAYNTPEDPTTLEPESVKFENNIAHVSWRHTHTALPGEPEARSRYAILIVPGEKLEQIFNTVSIAESMNVFTEGSREKIKIIPALKFRKKM